MGQHNIGTAVEDQY